MASSMTQYSPSARTRVEGGAPLDLYVEQVFGGGLTEKAVVASPAARDLHAGIGLTLSSEGQRWTSVNVSAASLQDKPSVFLTLGFTLLSF